MRGMCLFMVCAALCDPAHAATTAPAQEAMYLPLPRARAAMPLTPHGGSRFMPLAPRMANAVPLVSDKEASLRGGGGKDQPMSEEEAKLLLFIFGADD